jgi:hypothetical protein
VEQDYEGPFSCWKCHNLFSITIQGQQVKSWQPLSREEFQRQQEAEDLKAKLRQEAEALKAKFGRPSSGRD